MQDKFDPYKMVVEGLQRLEAEVQRLEAEKAKEVQNLKFDAAKALHQRPQSQASTVDQLAELIPWANRLGLYDAADFLQTLCKASKE